MQRHEPVLVQRHVEFEHLGHLGEILERHEIPFRYLELGNAITGVSLEQCAALVVMGGPMSANAPEPWVDAEIEAIRRAVALGRPVMGICLGAQLLARALGARVFPNRTKEIGWSNVHFTNAAAADPLFAGLPSPSAIFQWHGDTFDLPSGAELLAYTDECRNQAFRAGSAAYGLQFHLEVTPGMIQDWCEQDANCGDVRELTAPIDANLHSASQQELANLVFGRWIRHFLRDQVETARVTREWL